MSARLHRASCAATFGLAATLFAACGSSNGGAAKLSAADAGSSIVVDASASSQTDGSVKKGDDPCADGRCVPHAQCSSDGWCWENPLPQGNSIRSIWAGAKNDAWIVGSGGLAEHWDGRSWRVTPTGTTNAFHGVIAFAHDEAFAVATDGTQGDVFRWNGSAWSVMPRPSTAASWYGIWGRSADDLWVVGSSGNNAYAAHWTGASWTSHELPSGARAYGAWGTSASALWTVGDYGGGAPAINRWNGTSFSSASPLPENGARSVWGFASDDWWIADLTGASHWNGAAWQRFPIPDTQTWMSVWGATPSDVWFASYGHGLAHWDGSTVSLDPATKNRLLFAVSGSAQDDVWAGGLGGQLIHRAGAASPWTAVFDAKTPWLNDLSGTSDSDLWAVGTTLYNSYGRPAIAHGDGVTWALSALPNAIANDASAVLNGVSALAPNDAWAVGTSNKGSFAVRWSGSAWTDAGAVPVNAAADVWAADATHVFVVGNGPSFGASQIATWNGASWTATTCGGTSLFAIHGRAANDVWAVGEDGFACHFDGTSWTPKPTTTSAPVLSIATVGPNDAWAGTSNGQVLHWDGATWSLATTVPNGTAHNVRGIHADAAGNVVAVAATPYFQDFGDGFGRAMVLRRSSGTWKVEETGTTNYLSSLWSDGSKTWIAGGFGSVLRHD